MSRKPLNSPDELGSKKCPAAIEMFFGKNLQPKNPSTNDVNCEGNILPAVLVSLFIGASLVGASWAVSDSLLAGRKNETGLEEADIIDMTSIPFSILSLFFAIQVFRSIRGAQDAIASSRTKPELIIKITLGIFRIIFHELPSLLPLAIISVAANPLLLNLISPESQSAAFGSAVALVSLLETFRAIFFCRRSPFSIIESDTAKRKISTPSCIDESQETQAIHALNGVGILLPWLVVGPLVGYLSSIQMEDDADMGQALCLANCALIAAGIAFVPQTSLLVSCLNDRRKALPHTPPNKQGTASVLGQLNDRFLSGVLAAPALCAVLGTINALNGWNMDWIENPASYHAFCMTVTILLALAPYLTHGLDTGCRKPKSADSNVDARPRNLTTTYGLTGNTGQDGARGVEEPARRV